MKDNIVPLGNVVKFKPLAVMDYPKEDEAFNRLKAVLYEYQGELSIVAACGILDLLKDVVKSSNEQ